MLVRLPKLAERVYPDSQCGFQAEPSTVNMRQLQEKCREQHKPLYIAVIDLTKAFDLVSREGLFNILPKTDPPKKKKLHSFIRSFPDDMKATIQYEGSMSNPFDIKSGVKQGCVLAPTLFGSATEGVHLRTRSSGRLFNLSRLKAKNQIDDKNNYGHSFG